MAIVVALSNGAKAALANRLGGGTKKLEAKWLVFEDDAGTQFALEDSSIEITEASYKITATGTLLIPATFSTNLPKLYIVGDVGNNVLPNLTALAEAITGGTVSNYVISTTTFSAGDLKAPSAGDTVSGTTEVSFA